MNNKVKDIDIKNRAYYFFNGMINIESHKKYFYLLYWICDDKRFEVCKNL